MLEGRGRAATFNRVLGVELHRLPIEHQQVRFALHEAQKPLEPVLQGITGSARAVIADISGFAAIQGHRTFRGF